MCNLHYLKRIWQQDLALEPLQDNLGAQFDIHYLPQHKDALHVAHRLIAIFPVLYHK